MIRRRCPLPRCPRALPALLASVGRWRWPSRWRRTTTPPALPAAAVPAPERVAWFARFQDARSGPESIETVTRTFKVGPTGSLDIFNLAGPIVVTRHRRRRDRA